MKGASASGRQSARTAPQANVAGAIVGSEGIVANQRANGTTNLNTVRLGANLPFQAQTVGDFFFADETG